MLLSEAFCRSDGGVTGLWVPTLDFDRAEFMGISSFPMMSSWDRYRGFTFAHIVSRVWALRSANPLKKLRLCRN
nr:hypothetical protein CFP56_45762 [Quercus suber]